MTIYDEFGMLNGVFHYEILRGGNVYVNFAETQKCCKCETQVSARELERLDHRGIVQIGVVILENDNAFRGYHTFTCPKCSAKNRFKYEVRLISDIQPYIPIIDGYDLESTEGWSGNPRYIKPWLAVSR